MAELCKRRPISRDHARSTWAAGRADPGARTPPIIRCERLVHEESGGGEVRTRVERRGPGGDRSAREAAGRIAARDRACRGASARDAATDFACAHERPL